MTQTAKSAKTAQRVPSHAPDHIPETHIPEHEVEKTNARIRTRKRNSSMDRDDPLYVNLAAVPDDISLNWKRFATVGEENPFYLASLREQGWEPVNPLEHPDWVPIPPGYDKPFIIKNGLILMERPMALTREAEAEMRQDARQQIKEAEQRLGKGGDNEMDRSKPKLVKEMMRPIQVEE